MSSFSIRKAASVAAVWAIAFGFILLGQPQSVFALLASPTITAQASTPALVGGSLTDTATLAGGASPTGTVTFELRPGGCGSAPIFTSVKTVSGNGSYTSDSYGPLANGIEYNWQASYSGDANNSPISTLLCADCAQSVAVPQYCPPHPCPVPTTSCGNGPIVSSTSSTTTCVGDSARVTVTTVAIVGPATVCYGPEKSLSCSVIGGGTDYNTNTETVTAGAGAVEIPTLSVWGLLSLTVVLFGVGLWVIMGRD